ncbi:ABC transporter substrate-binding protein [Hymenobacter profundi]|uniref:ABC transporter substrate-binding protein n=1 Tax=Hymenobacter profundi TaxID=1982110 RepID=UPI001C583311|nr:ABC transporter substrate-binding protein [Hymenobacter profundi]
MRQFLHGLLLLVALGLGACSSSAPNPDTIRVRWAADLETLDPLLYLNSVNTTQTINLLYFSLLDNGQETVPLLAEALPSVRYTDSLTFITYRIHPAATWDNGCPVLARDVAFTLAVMNCPGLPNEAAEAQFDFIEKIKYDSTDQRRFTFVCRGRSPEFYSASGDFPILPEYALDPTGSLAALSLRTLRMSEAAKLPAVTRFVQRYVGAQLNRHPGNLPGCGPYRLHQWQSGRYLSLQRKPMWWGDKVQSAPTQLQAYPKKIVFDIIPDENTAVLALRRHQLDIYPRLPAKDYIRLKESAAAKWLSFYSTGSYEMVTVGFNTRRPMLHDRLTRQALSRLFNVPALIAGTQQGLAYRSVGIIAPQTKPYYNSTLPFIPYSLPEATVLLRQAGWRQTATGWHRATVGAATQHLKLTISYRTGDPAYEAAALQFRSAAATLNIPVTLRPAERSIFIAQLRNGESDVFLHSLSGNPTAFNFAPLFHSQYTNAGNYSGFGTPTSDKLIEELAAAESQTQKIELVKEFQQMMQEESPEVVLYFLRYQTAANAKLTGLELSPLKPGYNVSTVRLRKGS